MVQIKNLSRKDVTVLYKSNRVMCELLREDSGDLKTITHNVKCNRDGHINIYGQDVPRWKSHGTNFTIPEPEEGVLYLVDIPVAIQHPRRDDLLVATPYAMVKNSDGSVKGYTELAKIG